MSKIKQLKNLNNKMFLCTYTEFNNNNNLKAI